MVLKEAMDLGMSTARKLEAIQMPHPQAFASIRVEMANLQLIRNSISGDLCSSVSALFYIILTLALLIPTLSFAQTPTPPTSPSPSPQQLAPPQQSLSVLLVVGTPGTPAYEEKFHEEVTHWQTACAKIGATVEVIGTSPENATTTPTDHDLLKARLQKAASSTTALWLVFIGHGTYDGRESKFNLRGPDVTSVEIGEWLKPFKGELVAIDGASANAPFLRALSGKDRIIISATKSADEVFYTRFGEFFARAIGGTLPEVDLDRDGQVSVLEAFLWSSKQVERFFETEGRLATEHALIDDNGDGLGTRADWFDGLRCIKTAQADAKPDGQRARQIAFVMNAGEAKLDPSLRKHRDELERAVQDLRDQKSKMDPTAYYQKLEALLLEIGRLYQQAGPG